MNKIWEKLKNMTFVKGYRKIWPYVKPYWFRALVAVLITIPVGSLDAAIAMMLKPYTDTVLVDKNVEASAYVPILIVAFSLLQGILNYSATYFNTWVGHKITMDLKMALFRKMMRNESAFFDKNTSGNIQFRFNYDADNSCSGLLANLKMFTTRLFSSLSLIGVLFWNSWQLSIIALVFLFGALYPLSRVRKMIKGLMEKTVFSGSKVMTHYNEGFGGNRVVTSYNLYEYQENRFRETLRNVFSLGMKMVKKTGMLSPMMYTIISMGIAGVIWLGGHLIVTNQLTTGGFVAFIAALLMLYTPIKGIGNNFTSVQMAFIAMERVFTILEREPLIKSEPGAPALQKVGNTITYSNVCFEYVKGKPVLTDVDLTIPVGQTVAFVGNSGGGKTTFVNLLPRFYDVKSGSITIDGMDIRKFDLDSLRDKIAIVFQDNFLFDGTIRDNILLGRADISKERVDQILANSCLDEFISSLEKGLDTEIGERGILLSGGQKQRIAIARAFIKDAPIVILDEATSALDNKSEAVVQEAIANLMKDRTVLVIAHRLSTVRNADRIVVVNHGKIAETGTHDELIDKPNSIYSALYNTQLV